MLRFVDLRPRIAWNVRRLRARAGWTQPEAAVAAGVHPRFYQSVERGVGNVTVQTLSMLAAAFEVEDPLVLLIPIPDGATLEGPAPRGQSSVVRVRKRPKRAVSRS